MEVARLVAVFARDADLLVEPNCQTVTGLWVSADPVARLTRTVSPAELGAVVRRALAESRRGMPNPTNWREFPSGLLRAAGLRSWNALQRSAARCQIEAGSAAIRVLPSHNGGTRGEGRGYHSLEELAVGVPANATDEELGAAVLSAIAVCR